jgi:serine protease SohB
MDILWDTLGFAAKGAVVFFTTVLTVFVVLLLTRRRGPGRPHLEVKPLNARFEALGDALRLATMDRPQTKAFLRQRKKEKTEAPKEQRHVYVLDFDGDIMATAVTSLREEVSAITAVARPGDEVVLRLESGGGAVPHYGLAASQLLRLRDKDLKLTVCVDRVAASGGYMMACVAHRIVAAPFAMLGSIGVVAMVPNVHRLLKKHDVDFEQLTAGEFKRTLTTFGENTEKGRQKFQAQLEETHAQFKDFVKSHLSPPSLRGRSTRRLADASGGGAVRRHR